LSNKAGTKEERPTVGSIIVIERKGPHQRSIIVTVSSSGSGYSLVIVRKGPHKERSLLVVIGQRAHTTPFAQNYPSVSTMRELSDL
jgi:hypothetical protein